MLLKKKTEFVSEPVYNVRMHQEKRILSFFTSLSWQVYEKIQFNLSQSEIGGELEFVTFYNENKI